MHLFNNNSMMWYSMCDSVLNIQGLYNKAQNWSCISKTEINLNMLLYE
jgi:hypothetical protein